MIVMTAPKRIDTEPTTLTWAERYNELYFDMGLPIWQVAARLGLTLESLYRVLMRRKMPVPAELFDFLKEAP